ncbi:class I SAM-dependent methyltransferase [Microbacteriaceae bacterium 4G12]
MSIKKQVQQQFGKNAGQYVTSEIHAKGNDLTALLSIASNTNGGVALDIATGGGHVANGLAPLMEQVVALDLTSSMLEEAEAFIRGNGHSNVTFVQGDAENLPFDDNSFTIVTCRIAPHHFPNITAFITESYRVLQPNGTFLLIDNVAPEREEFDIFYNTIEKRRDYSHNRALKKSQWLTLVEEAGFETQQLFTFSKTFQFDNWCDRMALPLEEKKELEQFILQAPDAMQRHFHVTVQDNQLISFQVQSIFLICKK